MSKIDIMISLLENQSKRQIALQHFNDRIKCKQTYFSRYLSD